MTAPPLPEPTYVDNAADLDRWVKRLQTQARIAFDTESNSLHAYRGQTCLIQISIPDEDILIDPLLIEDIAALGEVFANPKIEKVFHAAEYDLICLKRDFDFDVLTVFDTMAAARVCGYRRVGLGAMLADLFGIVHKKTHQTDDWAQRPLPAGYLRYAQIDTRFLLPLRDRLHEELRRAGQLEEAREYFADVTAFELKSQEFDPNGFWSLCRPDALTQEQMAVLRELYILRDELARMYDYPAHRLMGNKALLAIARRLPRRRRQLYEIRGLPAWLARRNGDEMVEAVAHGRISRLPRRPRRQKPMPAAVVQRYTALHSWRRQTALARGVESDVIISKGALWDIARRQPETVGELCGIRGIGPWRRKTYGAALVAIANSRPPSDEL